MTKESEALATFLSACIDGEMNGDNMKKAMAEYVQPSVPAWHDAPTCAGLWMRIGRVSGDVALIRYLESDDIWYEGYRWFGPIPEDKK
jgi:hypothetical protein